MHIFNIYYDLLMFTRLQATEANRMPRPLPLSIRQEVVRRHQLGDPFTDIAADLGISYGAAREIWGRFREGGPPRLAPSYSHRGRPVPPRTSKLLELACELKRLHPGWAPAASVWSSARRPAAPPSRRPAASNSPSRAPESIGLVGDGGRGRSKSPGPSIPTRPGRSTPSSKCPCPAASRSAG